MTARNFRRDSARDPKRNHKVADTAINYRSMRSEQVVGKAIQSLMADGISRSSACVVTKGGFVPSRLLCLRCIDRCGDWTKALDQGRLYIAVSLQQSIRNTSLGEYRRVLAA